jgi:glycosyltransferase involved in cell wall biosynthesis
MTNTALTISGNSQTAQIKQLIRDKGLLSEKSVDVIIPFFNEEGNVANAHRNAEKLDQLFNIRHFIYINNGSNDGTQAELEKLSARSEKVRIVHIGKNIGYGNGFKKGFEQSMADYVITNHADQQFDAFGFYSGLATQLKALPEGTSIFSERRGRPISSSLFTTFLRVVLSTMLGQRLKEFNGQPKLVNRAAMTVSIDQFPNDFTFDLMLYLASGKKNFYPILEQKRESGDSSWNRGLSSKYRLFRSYLKSACKIKEVIQRASAKTDQPC